MHRRGAEADSEQQGKPRGVQRAHRPGGDTLSVAAAAKIEEFYDKGGVVIATSKLPTKSAEFGRDKEIQKMVGDVFGLPVNDPPTADLQRAMGGRLVTFYFYKRNAAGGQAYFLPKAEPWVLQWALGRVLPVRDVNLQEPIPLLKKGPDYDGALTYMHKVKDGQDIYFFCELDRQAGGYESGAARQEGVADLEPAHRRFAAGRTDGGRSEWAAGDDGPTWCLPAVSALFYVQE